MVPLRSITGYRLRRLRLQVFSTAKLPSFLNRWMARNREIRRMETVLGSSIACPH